MKRREVLAIMGAGVIAPSLGLSKISKRVVCPGSYRPSRKDALFTPHSKSLYVAHLANPRQHLAVIGPASSGKSKFASFFKFDHFIAHKVWPTTMFLRTADQHAIVHNDADGAGRIVGVQEALAATPVGVPIMLSTFDDDLRSDYQSWFLNSFLVEVRERGHRLILMSRGYQDTTAGGQAIVSDILDQSTIFTTGPTWYSANNLNGWG